MHRRVIILEDVPMNLTRELSYDVGIGKEHAVDQAWLRGER